MFARAINAWYAAVLIATVLCVTGCRDADEQRVLPKGGVSTETVKYDAPNPTAKVIDVPTVAIGNDDLSPTELGPLAPVPQNAPLAFEGEFTARRTGGAWVTVVFYQTTPSGERQITSELMRLATPSEDGKSFTYRLDLVAPAVAGTHAVEVSVTRVLLPDGDSTEQPPVSKSNVLAVGEMAIE